MAPIETVREREEESKMTAVFLAWVRSRSDIINQGRERVEGWRRAQGPLGQWHTWNMRQETVDSGVAI